MLHHIFLLVSFTACLAGKLWKSVVCYWSYTIKPLFAMLSCRLSWYCSYSSHTHLATIQNIPKYMCPRQGSPRRYIRLLRYYCTSATALTARSRRVGSRVWYANEHPTTYLRPAGLEFDKYALGHPFNGSTLTRVLQFGAFGVVTHNWFFSVPSSDSSGVFLWFFFKSDPSVNCTYSLLIKTLKNIWWINDCF